MAAPIDLVSRLLAHDDLILHDDVMMHDDIMMHNDVIMHDDVMMPRPPSPCPSSSLPQDPLRQAQSSGASQRCAVCPEEELLTKNDMNGTGEQGASLPELPLGAGPAPAPPGGGWCGSGMQPPPPPARPPAGVKFPQCPAVT